MSFRTITHTCTHTKSNLANLFFMMFSCYHVYTHNYALINKLHFLQSSSFLTPGKACKEHCTLGNKYLPPRVQHCDLVASVSRYITNPQTGEKKNKWPINSVSLGSGDTAGAAASERHGAKPSRVQQQVRTRFLFVLRVCGCGCPCANLSSRLRAQHRRAKQSQPVPGSGRGNPEVMTFQSVCTGVAMACPLRSEPTWSQTE